MIRRGHLAAVFAAALVIYGGCSPAGLGASPPAGVFILSGKAAPDVLSQCSRSSPAKGEGTFEPSLADIALLEAGLPRAVAERDKYPPGSGGVVVPMPGYADFSKVPAGWGRQYAGIIRGGHRFIYGNFFPESEITTARESLRIDLTKNPVVVCDGGPVFFGAEFDVERRQFTHLAFNGSV